MHSKRNNSWNLSSSSRLPKSEVARRHLFFEESLPSGAYSVYPVYGPVKKIAVNVEGSSDFSGVGLTDIVRLDNGTFRAYGTVRTSDQKRQAIGIWESSDGFNWSKRSVGTSDNLLHIEGIPGDQSALAWPQVVKLSDGKWRMYFWKHRDGHLRYTIAESDDGLAWHVPNFENPALFHPHDGGLLKHAEGLSVHEMIVQNLPPDEILRRKRLWTNDATYVYYNDQLDRYECYTVWLHPVIPDRRVETDNAPNFNRLIQRRFSQDGLEWSNAELIIWPDHRDPWDLQFYFLGVQWHEDWMIGMLGYYRVEEGQQSMDTDLCFSRDGYRWHRPVRGGWIPRDVNTPNAVDAKGIYAGGPWIDLGNCWLTIYQGTPNPHNSREYVSTVMGAIFPKNRLVGIAAGQTPGGFMTEPFFLRTREIRLDANIRGWLRAEVCDAFGRKLPGYHLMDSILVTGDSESHLLCWKDASVYDHQFECLRLRLEFTEGEVYGIAYA